MSVDESQLCCVLFLDGFKERDLRMRWNDVHPIEIEKDVTIAQFTLLKYRQNETVINFHHGNQPLSTSLYYHSKHSVLFLLPRSTECMVALFLN